jgi:hypothetical protein
VLEPAYDIAGDAFDYAANGADLHFAIFDGLGHSIGSTPLPGGGAGVRPAPWPWSGPVSRADQCFAELGAIEQREEGLRCALQVIEDRHVRMQCPVLD